MTDGGSSINSFWNTTIKRASESKITDRLELRQYPTKDIAARSVEGLNSRPGLELSLGHGRPKKPQLSIQDIHPGMRIRTPDVSKEPKFTEWKAPVYQPSEKKSNKTSSTSLKLPSFGDLRDSGSFSSTDNHRVVDEVHGARAHAEEYQALIRNLFPESPESRKDASGSGSIYGPHSTSSVQAWPSLSSLSPLSPRISDVLDQPAIPEILQLNEEEISDCCSSCASELGQLSETPQRFLHAKKARSFWRRPSSNYSIQGAQPDSAASAHSERSNRQRQPRRILQHGMADAYETLHRRLSSKSKSNPASGLRSSRDPSIVPDLDHGKKVPEMHTSLPLSREDNKRNRTGSSPASIAIMSKVHDSHTESSPMDDYVGSSKPPRANTDLLPKMERSVGRKLASALYNGRAQTEHREKPAKSKSKSKNKSKRGTANERREELKKKIMVVLPERVEGAKF